MSIACAVMGLLIGSFLTVVVDRVPDGRIGGGTAERVRGVWPSADGARPGADLLVGSRLRGKCRHCGHPIGIEPIDHRAGERGRCSCCSA